MQKSFALLQKDLRSEIRTRYAVNALLMFIVVTISVIVFSVSGEKVSGYLSGGLFWVVVFFTAMSGLSRAFVSEEERGTAMTLQLTASSDNIYTGKLFFNILLVFAMNIFIVLLYSVFMESFIIKNAAVFFMLFVLGSLGIAASSTIIAAIIAKANSKGTLYPVLSFPILLPLILTVIDLTKMSIDGAAISEAATELLVLVCYDVIMITASYLLFDFIWKD